MIESIGFAQFGASFSVTGVASRMLQSDFSRAQQSRLHRSFRGGELDGKQEGFIRWVRHRARQSSGYGSGRKGRTEDFPIRDDKETLAICQEA